MKRRVRDKTAFAYEDVGVGDAPFLLVHGWPCKHAFLPPQIAHFGRFYWVIAPDLCGRGSSINLANSMPQVQ
jgi:pimeloyl-ACP methyl ester carboxylesterase